MKTALPGGVVALGLVSLVMDMSSEMIHALLPLYLTGVMMTLARFSDAFLILRARKPG